MVNLFGWCLCGLLIGWAANRINRHPSHATLALYAASSVMGATLGGMVALTFEVGPLDDLSLLSLGAAMIGALLGLYLVRQLIRRLL